MSSEETVQWWDTAHKSNIRQWLSGNGGPKLWDTLGIRNRVQPGAKILEIGVGTGADIGELVNIGIKDIYVLDICEAAVDKVRDHVIDYWLAENFNHFPVNHFDLALSHLVSQHMSDEDLLVQMKHVIRSLKPTGVFAVQYAECNEHSETQTGRHQRGVEFCGLVMNSQLWFIKPVAGCCPMIGHA